MPEQLEGGNSGVVIRDGDVIRKPAGPWTPQVHAFMRALRDRGVRWVPEPFGVDDQGREVIEYVEGDVGIYPMPDWVWSDGHLVAFIDWDYATPGPRLWDLGYLAYRWLPMGPADGEEGHSFPLEVQQRRMRLLCETYGGVTPQEVLDWAIARLEDLISYSREQVAAGNPTFIATHEAGHTAFYEREVAWIRREWRP